MIKRNQLLSEVKNAIERSRIVVLLGPRQCGKTTLARELVDIDSPNYFDLEDPVSLTRLDEPMTALRPLKGLVVIDEVQRKPDIFPILRVLSDRSPLSARFLILGSASPGLLRQSSESLAGRVEHITMSGFNLGEVGKEAQSTHWLRGGFPLSYLASTDNESIIWRKNFIRTFLEHDLPQMGIRIPSTTLQRFWAMIAHYHGQVWSSAEPARSLSIGETSIRRYLDLLTDVFMIRQLKPWHSNIVKRQIKSPKIYFRDSGLLHYLLGIKTEKELLEHPKAGASWEGYVIEEVLRSIDMDEAYFWGTHGGAEIDLVVRKNGKMYGVECKKVDAPVMTPSMRRAVSDLELEKIIVIYPGTKRYPINEKIEAIPFDMFLKEELLFQ
jgi:uncharacterized protein